MQRILVIEDEKQLARVIKGYLEKAGFQVLLAYDGRTGYFIARQEKPDLIILDLMLPEMDGLDVCRALRRDSDPIVADVPIIMLTARIEETDKLIGLELGADDYITKPFSPRELVARVRTVLRRLKPVGSGRIENRVLLRAHDLTLDPERREVRVQGRLIDLTPTEFGILHLLMQHPGRPFSRAEILDKVQGIAFEVYERSVDVHVKNLRRKLGDDPRRPRYIQTIYGVGYKFIDEVVSEKLSA